MRSPHQTHAGFAELGRPILGVGLKLHLDLPGTIAYLQALRTYEDGLEGVHTFVLPSAVSLRDASDILGGTSIRYGAQDVHWESRGGWTGANSPADLVELGCTYAEIGHMERRRHLGETDDMVARKVAAAGAAGLIPIVCVGASEDHAHGGSAAEEAVREARAALGRSGTHFPLVVAYEPAWAIGSSESAEVDQVRTVVAALRNELAEWHAPKALLYGGSVSDDTLNELRDGGVDGFFVGRAAIDPSRLLRLGATIVEMGASFSEARQ